MRLAAAGATVALGVALAACGGDASGDGGGELAIFAAASLTEVFRELAPDARFNFAGSDELATQIREGAPADLYAAASLEHARALHAEGLVGEPRVFATNKLVLVVPSDNPARIRGVPDLRGAGVEVVIGAEGVPVGDYARAALANLGETAVLANVVSYEDDVKGVLGKVAAGEADAGFVYATDARAAAGDVVAFELPAEAQVDVRYPIAIATGSPRAEQARELVHLVLGERGREALRAAGFGLP